MSKKKKDNPIGNKLFYGDNLDILKRYIDDETVDLVYLDPPFQSGKDYNILFDEQDGKRSTAQVKAFTDTWRWDTESARAYLKVVEARGNVSKALQAFRTFLGESNMLAYLSMMAPRLVELRRVLKSTGSIYLHCDPTASHYLKMLMDSIFSPKNFRNEIVWHYNTGGKGESDFLKKHDTILRYSKSSKYIFNWQACGISRKKSTAHLRHGIDKDGREFYEDFSPRKSGKQYRWYLDKGLVPMDVWVDIQALNPMARERLGYPTQKPEKLLERIIKASTNEGDTVLDPFCGCGTAVASAQKLKRKWIGIDITHLATNLIKHRLQDSFGQEVNNTYEIIGEPTTLSGAEALAKIKDRYPFQWWALGLVGARPKPIDQKKGPDGRIDGVIYFHDENNTKTKTVLISVKSGKGDIGWVDELGGVVSRKEANFGVLISMKKPTPGMYSRAASYGFYSTPGYGDEKKYQCVQLLTIEDLLTRNGKIDMPSISQRIDKTYKKAPRIQYEEDKQAQGDLF